MSTAELQSSSSTTDQSTKPKQLTAEQKDQLQGAQEALRGAPFPPTDGSAITLTLQARGERFARQVTDAAKDLGFHDLKDHFAMGFKNHDTDKTLAYISNSMGHGFPGPHRSATVYIEPEKHVMEFATAGTCFIGMIQKLAKELSADIIGPEGLVLSQDELQSLGEQVNARILKKLKEDRDARTTVMPDGEVRVHDGLSFTYDILDKRGNWDRTVFFDAPMALVSEGRALGMAMAAELIKYHRTHKRGFIWFSRVLEAAFEAKRKSPRTKYNKPCVGNVVDGFLDGIDTLIMVGGRFANPEWFEARIAQSEENHAEVLAEKAEFAERMRDARAAAAAKRSAAAQGGSSK
ncbi:hypothetical protein [Comamonas sp.]|uniref:hypothetical protein n=1 Tax=Comamonas sp. TaxID=34028 RepID=UPI0028A28D8B|nr:hypothetical protein [Comamonas sp.]